MRATGVFLRPAAKLGFSIFEGAYGTGLLITNPETAQQFANSIYSFASNDPIATTKASLNQFLDQPSYEIGTQVFAGAGSAVISGGAGASVKSAMTKGFSSGGGFPPSPALAVIGGEFGDSAAVAAIAGDSFNVPTAMMMSAGQIGGTRVLIDNNISFSAEGSQLRGSDGKFVNTLPNDLPDPTNLKRGELHQMSDGRWKTFGVGEPRTAKGNYNYIVQDGKIYVGLGDSFQGHIDISRASPVDYAGQISFGSGKNTKGILNEWNNGSGRYKPEPAKL